MTGGARFPHLVLLACLVVLTALFAPGARGAGEDGQAVFDQSCKGCHTIGGGKLVGPDLQGLATLRDRAWVESFIRDPAAVVASGDPVAKQLVDEYGMTMPTLGLTDAQLAAVLAYLGFQEQSTPAPTTPTETTPAETPPPPKPTAGDPDRGKRLFEGADRLAGGGPACLSCHSVSGVGALGGGRLGPDLTGAAAQLGGESGLASWLTGTPSPTMTPIFSRHPLTARERVDLAAFITSAASAQRDSGQALKLVGLAAALALLSIGLAGAIWRRRLRGVRRPLVDRATGRAQ